MTETGRTLLVAQLHAAAAYLTDLIKDVEADSEDALRFVHLAADAVAIGTRIEVAFGEALDPAPRVPVRF